MVAWQCPDPRRASRSRHHLEEAAAVFRCAEETVEVHLDFVIDGKSLRTWIQEWKAQIGPRRKFP